MSVIGNQKLCKLIALADPYNEPDLEEPDSLLFTKIFPFPKVPEASDTKSTYLNIYFSDFTGYNLAVKSGILTFDVFTHIDLWRIPNSMTLRPLAILHEIDEMINQQRIVGIKKAQFRRGTTLFANSNYVGFGLNYEIASGN